MNWLIQFLRTLTTAKGVEPETKAQAKKTLDEPLNKNIELMVEELQIFVLNTDWDAKVSDTLTLRDQRGFREIDVRRAIKLLKELLVSK